MNSKYGVVLFLLTHTMKWVDIIISQLILIEKCMGKGFIWTRYDTQKMSA